VSSGINIHITRSVISREY